MSRNYSYGVINNAQKIYRSFIRDRGKKFIRHFTTPMINYPSPAQIQKLNIINHTWKMGDRFYKLSEQYYGTTQYWWVIAWFNKRPMEAEVSLGDVIYIPLPLDDVLALT